MPPSPPVSCLVFTLNEEVNLPYCLATLEWCNDVVVVDSFSTDRTETLARDAGARFVRHEFTGFGDQRNWVLRRVPLKHPWALILDADERLTPELVTEMCERLHTVSDNTAAFRLRRRFYFWGKWLRYSSLYPTWVVRLVRVGRVQYVNRGHAETQVVEGRVESLEHDLIDENQKGLADWWARQNRYSTQEALYELAQPMVPLGELFSWDAMRRRRALKSRARWVPGRPVWFFLYAYLFRLGFLDGLDGLRYCGMKAMYEALIVLKKIEFRRRGCLLRHEPPQEPAVELCDEDSAANQAPEQLAPAARADRIRAG